MQLCEEQINKQILIERNGRTGLLKMTEETGRSQAIMYLENGEVGLRKMLLGIGRKIQVMIGLKETSGSGGEGQHMQAIDEVWREDGSQEAVESWSEGPSDPPRLLRSVSVRRANRFHPPEDDNVYNMELRELLSRRSVSKLLRRGFRESLDQLIQSYCYTCLSRTWLLSLAVYMMVEEESLKT